MEGEGGGEYLQIFLFGHQDILKGPSETLHFYPFSLLFLHVSLEHTISSFIFQDFFLLLLDF